MAFPPFAVTSDVVVFTVVAQRLKVLLVVRANPPHQGALAIPGGFVDIDEDLEPAAARELAEETGIVPRSLHQIGAYGDPTRDPRMRVVTVAYWAVAREVGPVAGSDAAGAELVDVGHVLDGRFELAFDHHRILVDALDRLRSAVERTPVALDLCPSLFTITDLRRVYEAVWDVRLDPGNFHNKVTTAPGLVRPTGRRRRQGTGRPAILYRAGPTDTIEPPFRAHSLAQRS